VALEKGRDAFARHDWQAAYDELVPAAAEESAALEAIELLAEAAWWLGRLDECIELRERAFARRQSEGACHRAARIATLLYYDHCWQSRRAVAGGWLARARRLLEAESPCAEWGFLLVLEADALQCLGRLLIAQGQPTEGLALFDEAMLYASEGKLGLFTVGKVYCSLISACEELADFQRATEWTEVGVNWATPQPSPVFPGLCRVHRAEMLQLQGDWAEAEAEAQRACDELCDVNRFNAGLAYYEIGEIRRRLGDLDAAERAFRLAEDYGHHPQPGLALLRLAQGNRSGASAGIARALAEQEWNRLGRAKLLPAQVEIACAVGDLDVAKASAQELRETADQYGTTGLRAAALGAEGRVALAERDDAMACGVLRRALHEWQTLDLPYEVATARVLLARASRAAGDEEGASRSFDAAIALFERLGAVADLAATRAMRVAEGAELPCGLTAREAEVLRLVAAGHSNKEIAQRLALAQKTVARHVSNIFVKTGVSSRAGATAFAFERGIVGSALH
jgi:DNA-binding CsgD family transcriptional regulator